MFPNEKKPVVPGPGKLLQLAREEKNLRPEDVAYEIRLTPSQVLALDEDDYSRMPEETYIRGYLRNYARLVGVPENDILMAFARMIRAKDASALPVGLPEDKLPGKDNRSPVIIVVVGIVAIIALGAVWMLMPQGELSQDEKSTRLPETVEKPVIDEVPVGSSTLSLDTVETVSDKSVIETSIAETAGTPASKQKSSVEVPRQDKATTEKTVSSSSTDSSQAVKPQKVEKPTKIDTQPGNGKGVILIQYSKDSWTDVRDARGTKLLYRTVKAGEKIALAGELPISLFFGFAQGVKVKFNGKEVDINANTRGVFARFTVGEVESP